MSVSLDSAESITVCRHTRAFVTANAPCVLVAFGAMIVTINTADISALVLVLVWVTIFALIEPFTIGKFARFAVLAT